LAIILAGNLGLSAAQAQTANEGRWRLSLGPVFRGCMEVNFSGSSYAQSLGLNTDAGVRIGPADAYADRTYDNGYVGLAPSTGNPNAIDPNTTWNWGYNANSSLAQYDAAAGTLSFNRQGIPRYSALTPGGPGGRDNMFGAGLQLEAGFSLKQDPRWSLGLFFRFQAVWSEGDHRETARLVDITDTYDVAGISSTAFTDLGHRGTYDGPFDPAATPPYTIIPNRPASRRVSPSTITPAAQSRIAFDVDQSLYTLSLGPQIGVKPTERLQLLATPTISINIVDVDVHRSETFAYGTTTRQWSDRTGERQVYLGLGLTGGANLDLGKGWFIAAFGGYEWVMNDLNINIGPNRVSVDASGWVAALAVGKSL
jgi:hypothetical protein